MDRPLLILLGCWLALNFLAAPLLGVVVTRRRARAEWPEPAHTPDATVEPAGPRPRTDGYASLLLSRLTVQTCRVLAVEKACLLVSDDDNPDLLIAVAAHGVTEDVLGQRVHVDGPLHATLASGTAQAVRADRLVPGLGSGMAAAVGSVRPWRRLVLCAATANPRRQLRDREIDLLQELADLCAAAAEDVEIRYRLDATITASAAGLAADRNRDETSSTERGVSSAALARQVGARLRLEPGALVELELAAIASSHGSPGIAGPSALATDPGGARMQPTLRADPTETAERLARLPGFEVVALIVRFVAERWDGRGPHGLPGEQIPLASRILATCDAIGVLTAARPWGAGASLDTALRRVQAASGTVFDPTVVTAVSLEMLGEMPELAGTAPPAAWARADAQYAGFSS